MTPRCRPGRRTGPGPRPPTASPSWRWSTTCIFISGSTALSPSPCATPMSTGPARTAGEKPGWWPSSSKNSWPGSSPGSTATVCKPGISSLWGISWPPISWPWTYPQAGAFNIGTGRETDILTIYLQAPGTHGLSPGAGARPRQARGTAPQRPGQHPGPNELGWRPRVSLAQGLARAPWRPSGRRRVRLRRAGGCCLAGHGKPVAGH